MVGAKAAQATVERSISDELANLIARFAAVRRGPELQPALGGAGRQEQRRVRREQGQRLKADVAGRVLQRAQRPAILDGKDLQRFAQIEQHVPAVSADAELGDTAVAAGEDVLQLARRVPSSSRRGRCCPDWPRRAGTGA